MVDRHATLAAVYVEFLTDVAHLDHFRPLTLRAYDWCVYVSRDKLPEQPVETSRRQLLPIPTRRWLPSSGFSFHRILGSKP